MREPLSGIFKASALTVVMAVALVIMALLNEHLLRITEVVPGVNWLYLPAGLRMCYVLVLPVQGALAIFGGSLIMASRDPTLSWALVMASAAVTAAGPLMARTVAMQRVGLEASLGNLNGRMLCGLAALFGAFSTALHQAFYAGIGRDPAILSMWIGDTLGCLLCLYGLRSLTIAWRRWGR